VCGMPECDCEASIVRRPWSTRGCRAIEKNVYCRSHTISMETYGLHVLTMVAALIDSCLRRFVPGTH
jgi:hypothetical protein